MSKNTRTLALIVISSWLIKALLLVLIIHVNAGFTQPDSASYLVPAQHMLQGGSMWTDPSLWMRTPGYPLFLAAIFKVTGISFLAVAWVQLALSGLLVINAYRIAKILADATIGLWAAAIVALDYLFASFFALVLSDILFAIIFSFIFYYVIVFMKQHEKRLCAVIMVSLLLAVSTWIRPIPYYLVPLLAMSLFVYTWRTLSFSKAIIWALLVVLPSLLLVGGWQIRNKMIMGTYQYTSIDAVNFYHYYAADIVAHQEHIKIEAAQQQLEAKADALHLQGLARNDYYRQEGLHILLSHPLLSADQVLRGFLRMMFGSDYSLLYYSDSQWQQGKQFEFDLKHGHLAVFIHHANIAEYLRLFFTGLFHLFNIIVALAAMYFLVIALRSRVTRPMIIACLMVLIYFVLVSSNVCANARFRMPFQLMLDCFAVLGVAAFLKRKGGYL